MNKNLSSLIAAAAVTLCVPMRLVFADNALDLPIYHAVVLEALPDDEISTANGINSKRQICGYSQSKDKKNTPVFWTQSGKVTALPGGSGTATAINEEGIIVGSANQRAVLWRDGVAVDLGAPADSLRSEALGLNSHGDIVGYEVNAAGFQLPFVKKAGKPIAILSIPPTWKGGSAMHITDDGTVLGTITKSPKITHACEWKDDKPKDLNTLGGDYSEARDINSSGLVVGATTSSSNSMQACYWIKGVADDFGQSDDDGDSSIAYAVNDEGIMVGEGDGDARIWINTKTDILGNYVRPLGIYTLEKATAINNHGDILAFGIVMPPVTAIDGEVERAVLLIPQK